MLIGLSPNRMFGVVLTLILSCRAARINVDTVAASLADASSNQEEDDRMTSDDTNTTRAAVHQLANATGVAFQQQEGAQIASYANATAVALQRDPPNSGARCCQREVKPRCCTQKKAAKRKWIDCPVKGTQFNSRNSCAPIMGKPTSEVQMYDVVWQYYLNGDRVKSCHDMPNNPAKYGASAGKWWSFTAGAIGNVLGFGLFTPSLGADDYCKDPKAASSDTTMYALTPSVSLGRPPKTKAKCCHCKYQKPTDSPFRANGDCVRVCLRMMNTAFDVAIEPNAETGWLPC
jgi:hypothetical protein